MISIDAVMIGEKEENEGRTGASAALLAIVRAARDGDHSAFEGLMRMTERKVAQLAWRILGDAEDVKEATQETFLRVFRHLGRYDEARDFDAWLYRIAVNVCRDLARKRRLRRFFVPFGERPIAAAAGFDNVIAARSELALLKRAIDALPEKERIAIILREVEELPTESVAEIMGNTAATVRVQVRNARAKIRRWMASWKGGAK